MDLDMKIERAKTCVHFNPGRSGSGNCNLNGYAPFDCDACTSYKVNPKMDKSPLLNPGYWDCECDDYYIHPAKYKKCRKCGALRDEMPDSRQSEIDEGTHFYRRCAKNERKPKG